jgi:hypothetical protein
VITWDDVHCHPVRAQLFDEEHAGPVQRLDGNVLAVLIEVAFMNDFLDPVLDTIRKEDVRKELLLITQEDVRGVLDTKVCIIDECNQHCVCSY